MSDTNDDKTLARCRSLLATLEPSIRSRANHWAALPSAIERLIAYAEGIVDPLALQVVQDLTPFKTPTSLEDTANVRKMVLVGTSLAAKARELPGFREQGSLWLAAHGTIEQHMAMAKAGIDDLRPSLDQLIQDLNGYSIAAANPISERLSRTGTLADLTALADALQEARRLLLEKTTIEPKVVPLIHTRKFKIVTIDDEPEWQKSVLAAIGIVKEELGAGYTIETQCYGNAGDARIALTSEPSGGGRGVDADPMGRWQTIAIVDMGLPATADEAMLDPKCGVTPDRRNGQDLLHDLRSYRNNIPCIVLTSPAELLADQIQACQQGVEDGDYILKQPEHLGALPGAILRIILRAQAYRIEVVELPAYQAFVDGVPIKLGDMPFRTLFALCELSQSSGSSVYFNPQQILEALDERFGEVYDYLSDPKTDWERALVFAARLGEGCWYASSLRPAANIVRSWAACKLAANSESNISASSRLADLNPMLWKQLIVLIDQYRAAHPNGPWSGQTQLPASVIQLEEWIEAVFGGFNLTTNTSYDLSNIEKHINEIRQAVHVAFQKVHRFIEPRLLVRSGRMGEHSGYRIFGQVKVDERLDDQTCVDPFAEVQNGGTPAPMVVLVVENEPEYASSITDLLKSIGFDVAAATNSEDAVQQALVRRPQIISLDMHIPLTNEEAARDVRSGNPFGGLDALSRIREFLPNVKVVCPTTLSNRDDVRARAADLAVSISNFVPKGESSGGQWEGHLLLTMNRLRQEIRLGAILPALAPWRRPVVQVMPGSSLDNGVLLLRVNGRESSFKRKPGKILSLLLRKHDELVSREEIDFVAWGAPASNNTRNQQLAEIRTKIREEWLSGDWADDARPELDILENVSGGFVLHAHVGFTE